MTSCSKRSQIAAKISHFSLDWLGQASIINGEGEIHDAKLQGSFSDKLEFGNDEARSVRRKRRRKKGSGENFLFAQSLNKEVLKSLIN